jgi:hypothetical protein
MIRVTLISRAVIVILLIVLTAGGQQVPSQSLPDWQTYTSEAGAFAARFPGMPSIDKVTSKRGPIELVRITHILSVGDYYFEIDYFDMPAGYNEPDMSLEGAASGIIALANKRGGQVLTTEKITRSTCEGREITVRLPGPTSIAVNSLMYARIFNSGQRYYTLIFQGTPEGDAVRKAASYFMDSFSVKGGCSAAVAPTAAPSGDVARTVVEGTLDSQTGWRRIDATSHSFSVLMPGTVKVESEQAQVQPFPLSHHTYLYEEDGSFYSAEVIGDYPQDFYNSADNYEVALDLILYALKKNLEPVGYSFTFVRKLKVGNFPGREYNATNSKTTGQGRVQIYATPKKTYIFMAVDNRPPVGSTNLDRFFSSLRISPR